MVYVYGMKARGYSLGCQPKEGFLERMDDVSDSYYDILVYERHLSAAELREYELDFLGEIE